jgi:hypothetical protein
MDRDPGTRAGTGTGRLDDPEFGTVEPDVGSSPDETRDASGQRLCGYRGCRALLPSSSGRGNKAKYCQDGKTWGPKQLSCKQAALALEQVASLTGQATIPHTSITELGGHIAAALVPARQLVTALADVQAQLEEAVTIAQRERAEALAEAAEQQGLRYAADQRADDADEAATAAARSRVAAEADRDREIDARRTAERAQERAEVRIEDARDAVRRADNRAEAAAQRAAQLDHELVAATAELTALRVALEEERQRCNAGTERANTLISEHTAKLEELRHTHQTRIERLHAQHADVLEAAHRKAAVALDQARRDAAAETTEAVRRVRTELEQKCQAEAECHAGQLAELHQQIGGLLQQITADTVQSAG